MLAGHRPAVRAAVEPGLPSDTENTTSKRHVDQNSTAHNKTHHSTRGAKNNAKDSARKKRVKTER